MMTWTKQRHRLSILSVVLGLTLGVVSVSHAQRFVRPINSIPELVASNPNDPHTNVFIPQGPTGPGLFYQWRKNDGTTTNSNLSVLGTDWPGASGRWHNIPIAQGSITGISNSGTNGFAVVNTLADLKNIPGNLGIGMVYIRGHSQAYDWGQGFFSRVDDCSVPDDDGLTSVHGNDALTCWTRENRFPWSGTPVQYAGGTVTRTIINTVSEHLSTQGGGTVIITDGSWDIDTSNGPILGHSNVSIVGMASALLVGDGVGDMFNWTNINNAAILQIGISNVVNGVVLRGATNVLIGGNPISDVGDGVLQYGGDNVRIEHNIFATVTNGVHFSLDGAVKVTGGALIGNTFSGVIGSEVLEDAGVTDGYRKFDSNKDFRLAKLDSILWMGTNKVVWGDPGTVYLGPHASTYFGATPPGPGVYVSGGESNPNWGTHFYLADTNHFATENSNYVRSGGGGRAGHSLLSGGSGYTLEAMTNNVRLNMFVDNSTDRVRFSPGATTETSHLLDTSTFITSSNLFEVFNNFSATSNTLPRFGVGHSGYFQTLESAAPGTPPNGGGYWYVGTDSKPRFKDDSGTDYDLTSTGGGVAGSDTQVQFNDGGAFGADADFAWDKTANLLKLGGRTDLEQRTAEDFYQVTLGDNMWLGTDGTTNILLNAQGLSPRSNYDLGSTLFPWQNLILSTTLQLNGIRWTAMPNAAETQVTGPPGSIHVNTTTGDIWRKATGVGNTGWVLLASGTTGSSDTVVGPASATDNAISRYDGTTGKLIQNSTVIVSDAGALNAGNGSAALVTYGFASDPDTGMWRGGSGELTWSVDGVNYLQLNGNELELGLSTSLVWGLGGATDLLLIRKGANNLQIGPNSASVHSPQLLQAGNGGGTDIPGGDLGIAGGQSTGAGTGGAVKLKTSPRTASSGSANSHVDRFIVAPEKTLTDAATSLFEIALPTLKATSGTIKWGIIVTDGTDVQAYGGVTVYSAVNKGGVYTKTVSTTAADTEAKSVSAGTLTATFSLLDGTNKLTMQVTPAGSLTETTYQIYYTLENNSPQAITLL